jgi:hypothetical protein
MQNIIACSSMEAKYKAMTSTTNELTWIMQVLANLSIDVNELMKIFYDNQAARYFATNYIFHECTNISK